MAVHQRGTRLIEFRSSCVQKVFDELKIHRLRILEREFENHFSVHSLASNLFKNIDKKICYVRLAVKCAEDKKTVSNVRDDHQKS